MATTTTYFQNYSDSRLLTQTPTGLPYISSDFPRGVRTFLTLLYVAIVVAALILNGLICYLFIKGKVKTSSFNLLLLMLSISDIAAVISVTPYVFLNVKAVKAPQETLDYLCGVTVGISLFWVCTFVSVFILCLISLNRYFLINHPMRALWLRQKKTVWISFVLFWIFAVILWTPSFVSFRYDQHTGLCYRNWPRGFKVTVYTFSMATIGVIVPILFMMTTFIVTARTLWGRKVLTGRESTVIRGRKRIASLLGILILAYFLCSFPSALYFIFSRTTAVFPNGLEGEYLRKKISRIVVLLALLNTVLDPLIYGLRSSEFREGFRRLKSQRRRSHARVTSFDIKQPSSSMAFQGLSTSV